MPFFFSKNGFYLNFYRAPHSQRPETVGPWLVDRLDSQDKDLDKDRTNSFCVYLERASEVTGVRTYALLVFRIGFTEIFPVQLDPLPFFSPSLLAETRWIEDAGR